MSEIIPGLSLEDVIHNEKKPLLVDIYADWCPPCREIAPVIDALSLELADQIRIVKVNRDEADANGGDDNPVRKLMKEKGALGIPALMLFENGNYIDMKLGAPQSRQGLLEWLEKKLDKKLTVAPKAAPKRFQPPTP